MGGGDYTKPSLLAEVSNIAHNRGKKQLLLLVAVLNHLQERQTRTVATSGGSDII